MKRIFCFCLALALIVLCLPTGAFAASAALPTLKVLCIGHSYAWNAAENLNLFARAQGIDLTLGVAFRGNCSIKAHYEALLNQDVYGPDGVEGCYLKYDADHPVGITFESFTLGQMIKDEPWDAIVFQECLEGAGYFENFKEDLRDLFAQTQNLVENENCRYYFHEIWALEQTSIFAQSENGPFSTYHNDQETMYRAVKKASGQAAEWIGGTVIPSANAFQRARAREPFNVEFGGYSLNVDSVGHANAYGKYLAAAVWFETLTRCAVNTDTLYRPDAVGRDEAMVLVTCATEAVKAGGITLGAVDEIFLQKSDESTGSKSATMPDEETTSPTPWVALGCGISVVFALVVVMFCIHRKNKNKEH